MAASKEMHNIFRSLAAAFAIFMASTQLSEAQHAASDGITGKKDIANIPSSISLSGDGNGVVHISDLVCHKNPFEVCMRNVGNWGAMIAATSKSDPERITRITFVFSKEMESPERISQAALELFRRLFGLREDHRLYLESEVRSVAGGTGSKHLLVETRKYSLASTEERFMAIVGRSSN